jgi:hypothetical protein
MLTKVQRTAIGALTLMLAACASEKAEQRAPSTASQPAYQSPDLRIERTTAVKERPLAGEGTTSGGVGLCSLDVGAVDVDITSGDDRVVIVATSDDPAVLQRLWSSARGIASGGSYVPVAALNTSANAPYERSQQVYYGVAVKTTFVDLDNGVRIVLVPDDPNDVATLAMELDNDRDYLGEGRCAPPRET